MFAKRIGMAACSGLLISMTTSGTSLLAFQEPKKTQAQTLKDPIVECRVADVQNVFWYNEAAAEDKYAGKRVRVTGQLDRIKRQAAAVGSNAPASYWLIMRASPQSAYYLPVIFEFNLDAHKQLASFSTRAVLTIEGDCLGRREKVTGEEAVFFSACKIVEPAN